MRDFVTCASCDIPVHKQCLIKISKLVKINIEDFTCKSCKEKKCDVTVIDKNKIGSSEQLQNVEEKFELVCKLNKELQMVNKLLKLRLNEVDKNFKNGCAIDTVTINDSKENNTDTNTSRTPKQTFKDIL